MAINSSSLRYWKVGVANASSILILWTTRWPSWPTVTQTHSSRQMRNPPVPHQLRHDYPATKLSNESKRTVNGTNDCENAAGFSPSHIRLPPNYPCSPRSSHSRRIQVTRIVTSQICPWISSLRMSGKLPVTGMRTTTRRRLRRQTFVLENRFFSLLEGGFDIFLYTIS